MRKLVFALATLSAIGAACSLAWAGSATLPHRGTITPRLKRLPVADLVRVAHGDGPGSAAPVAAGALLAAVVIGTGPALRAV
jgi:hypothetical protein